MANLGDMDQKICIITGATSGIGKATAIELARRGATVILLCRNGKKGAGTVREIQELTQNLAIDLLVADLSSQRQIRAAAAEFTRKYDRLHVLINNAGAMFSKRSESLDGIEMTLAINHLAPFLLTNLLLGIMKSTGPARIINVNSDAHERGKIDFTDLQMRRHYGQGVGMRAYANAKLSNLLTAYELAHRLQGTQVTLNALHPGYVATNIVPIKDATGPWRLLKPFWGIANRLILTPEKGAATSIFLACTPLVARVSGKYFKKCAPTRSSRISHDRKTQFRMWERSLELTRD
jgi:NAD(P)-dependent dehydrogenase (short-subunit alcohol dehydrogenase family)